MKNQAKYKYSFERLLVWQEAKRFSIEVYKITKNFPDDERFGLTSQLRRASVSVSSNIAEGSGRSGKKDQVRFYSIAYGSLMECLSLLVIAKELNFLSNNDTDRLEGICETIAKMLSGLVKKNNES